MLAKYCKKKLCADNWLAFHYGSWFLPHIVIWEWNTNLNNIKTFFMAFPTNIQMIICDFVIVARTIIIISIFYSWFFSRNKLDPFQLFQFYLLISLDWFFSLHFFFTFPFAIKTFQLFKALLRSDSNDDYDMCVSGSDLYTNHWKAF